MKTTKKKGWEKEGGHLEREGKNRGNEGKYLLKYIIHLYDML